MLSRMTSLATKEDGGAGNGSRPGVASTEDDFLMLSQIISESSCGEYPCYYALVKGTKHFDDGILTMTTYLTGVSMTAPSAFN